MNNTATTNVKNVAKHYRRTYEFNVIPLKARSKAPALPQGHPFLKQWATEEEFENFDFKNVGIVTGIVSGIIVVDEDKVGALKEQGWDVPTTTTAQTYRGFHYYFKYPGFLVKNRTSSNPLAPGVELKGDGGYVVAPPSVIERTETAEKGIRDKVRHQYKWVHSPDEVGIAECPDWLLEELARPSDEGLTAPVEETIGEGGKETPRYLAGHAASSNRATTKQRYTPLSMK